MAEDKTATTPQQPSLEGVSNQAPEAPTTAAQAAPSKDDSESILQVVKRDASKILENVKVLPKEHKVKLYIGVFLILSSIIAYNSYGVTFIIFGFFVPSLIGAIWVISGYNQKDFIHEIVKSKTPKPQVGEIVIEEEYDKKPKPKK